MDRCATGSSPKRGVHRVGAETFLEYFGPHIKRWCEQRAGSRKLTTQMAIRWGLTTSEPEPDVSLRSGTSSVPNAIVENQSVAPWAIREIVYFDGKEDCPLGYHGREENSSQWHRIDFYTLNWGENIPGPSSPSTSSVNRSDTRTVVAAHGTRFGTEVAHLRLDRLDTYMIRNQNKPYVLNTAGERSSSSIPDAMYKRSLPVQWQHSPGKFDCVILSLLNDLWILLKTDSRLNHQETARKMHRLYGKWKFANLWRAASSVNGKYSQYRLQAAITSKAERSK